MLRCRSPVCGERPEVLADGLERCAADGVVSVIVDLEGCPAVSPAVVTLLREAALRFEAAGGELVVAVEAGTVRDALVRAGLAGPPEPSEAGPSLPSGGALALPDVPHWQHEFGFSATPEDLTSARRRVMSFVEVCGFSGAALFELGVAVGEALANAVQHGSPHGELDDVTVRFYCYPDEVAVEVCDQGEGIAAAPICAPDALESAGRGIHFMRALSDAMLFTCSPQGTRVLLVKKRR